MNKEFMYFKLIENYIDENNINFNIIDKFISNYVKYKTYDVYHSNVQIKTTCYMDQYDNICIHIKDGIYHNSLYFNLIKVKIYNPIENFYTKLVQYYNLLVFE